jgi:hypothetical protein
MPAAGRCVRGKLCPPRRGFHLSTHHLNLSRLVIEPCCVQLVTSYDPSIALHATETTQRIPQKVFALS